MTVIEKIEELKVKLAEELKKEEVNKDIINQIKIKIMSLGIYITPRDMLTRNHG